MPREPRTSTTATAWCLHEPWAARICFFASFGYIRQCHRSKNGRSHTWRTPSVDKSAFVIRRESIYSHTTRNKTPQNIHLGAPFSANDNPRAVFNRRSQFVPRSHDAGVPLFLLSKHADCIAYDTFVSWPLAACLCPGLHGVFPADKAFFATPHLFVELRPKNSNEGATGELLVARHCFASISSFPER